jgi:hypothetical protein
MSALTKNYLKGLFAICLILGLMRVFGLTLRVIAVTAFLLFASLDALYIFAAMRKSKGVVSTTNWYKEATIIALRLALLLLLLLQYLHF